MALKDELQDCNEIQALDYEGKVVEFVEWSDVLAAVKELKNEVDDLYHKLGKVKVWHQSNDGVADIAELYIKKKIDEVFGK